MHSSVGGALLMGILYFLPTIIAYNKKHRNATAVLLINLFLGRTVIGWFAALIMAVWNNK